LRFYTATKKKNPRTTFTLVSVSDHLPRVFPLQLQLPCWTSYAHFREWVCTKFCMIPPFHYNHRLRYRDTRAHTWLQC